MLVNVFIVDPTCIDLFPWSCFMQGFTISKATLKFKERDYQNQHPTKQFLWALVIEIFGCSQEQANKFLHDCADKSWGMKDSKGSPFFLTWSRLFKNYSLTLLKPQTSYIINWAIAMGWLIIRSILSREEITRRAYNMSQLVTFQLSCPFSLG